VEVTVQVDRTQWSYTLTWGFRWPRGAVVDRLVIQAR